MQYANLVGPGENGVALLVGEKDGGGDEQGLDGLAQPPHQLRLGGQPFTHLHAQVDLGQGVRQQSEPAHKETE